MILRKYNLHTRLPFVAVVIVADEMVFPAVSFVITVVVLGIITLGTVEEETAEEVVITVVWVSLST